MAIKHVKGEFSFPAEFGFTGSAQGRHDPKEHADQDDGEYGDGLAKGGKARRNRSMQEHHDETEYAHRVRKADGGDVRQKQKIPYDEYNGTTEAFANRARELGGDPSGNGDHPGKWKENSAAWREYQDSHEADFDAGIAEGRDIQAQREGYARGGKAKRHFADGGPMGGSPMSAPPPAAPPMQEPTISMPMSTAKHVARKLVQAGAVHGAKAAVQGLAGVARARQAQGAPSAPPPPARSPLPPQGALSGMAEGGKFIQHAIKHPGRMKRGAEREGVSTHEYMEEHDKDPGSLGSAARLGLRMTGKGDLSPHRKKR